MLGFRNSRSDKDFCYQRYMYGVRSYYTRRRSLFSFFFFGLALAQGIAFRDEYRVFGVDEWCWGILG